MNALFNAVFALVGTLTAAVHAQPTQGREIVCSPSVVGPADTLTITTRQALPQVAVRVPDKNIDSLFLVNDFDPGAMMHSRDFMRQKGAVLPVATAAMKNGVKVFTKPGVYRFAASTNLETDDGTPQYVCNVTYKTK